MTNRLAGEASLYLRQHAGNPVDWYPWGDEAFRRAADLDRPLFVSVGYSACHWCHVMAHESFASDRIAGVLNSGFVCVKVDREERPDVDAALMAAVMAMTGHGGWPLSAFVTPDGRVFHGGTYFPPVPRGGMPGFGDVLVSVAASWADRRPAVLAFADRVAEAVAMSRAASEAPVIDPASPGSTPTGRGSGSATGEASYRSLSGAVGAILRSEDLVNGGFGRAPKFPQGQTLLFLLGWAARHGDSAALAAAARALGAMATGGIHDQIGGGFHRYAVDERWAIPHFEKMLYDNALLLRAYVEAFQLTGIPRFRQVALSTAGYLVRDMVTPGGGLAASTDADAEGVEGATFCWRPEELSTLLAPDEAAIAAAWYGIHEPGNFDGLAVPSSRTTLAAAAALAGLDETAAAKLLPRARAKMLAHRAARPQPQRDEKVIVAWNGLAIDALARAATALEEPELGAAAERAARFILRNMGGSGRLARMWDLGAPRGHGFLEDYAAMAGAAITLFEWSGVPEWLEWSCELVESLLRRFDGAPVDTSGDSGSGALRRAGSEHGDRLAPERELLDGAEPSGNASAASALLRAGAITCNDAWTDRAEDILRTASPLFGRAPSSMGGLLAAADEAAAGVRVISIIGPEGDQRTRGLAQVFRSRYVPGVVVARAAHPEAARPAILSGPVAAGGAPAATICRLGSCGPPLAHAEALEAALELPAIDLGTVPALDLDPSWI